MRVAVRMAVVTVFGMMLAADFTAPALLALLILIQPQTAVLQMLAACVLHESAHFLAAAIMHQRPASLHISAAGLRLTLRQSALCPFRTSAVILSAGAAANFLAAAVLRLSGHSAAAGVQLAIGMFNLLPYRCTDGGTLLELTAAELLLPRHGAWIPPLLRGIALTTSVLLGGAMLLCGLHSVPLAAMLCYLTAAEFTGTPLPTARVSQRAQNQCFRC